MLSQIACLARDRTLPVRVRNRVATTNRPPHCQRPSLPSLFGMPYGHSLSCLLIRRYHMSAVTFCLLLCVPRYQLAQTPVSPHGAAGQQKQTPRLSMCICKTAVFTAPLFQKYTAVWGPPEICRRCCLISVKYRKIDFWSVRCIFGTAPYGKWQW